MVGNRKVATWERSRHRHGLWVGTTRLAFIAKEPSRNRWQWSIDVRPYTCGAAGSIFEAKNAVAAELKRIQDAATNAGEEQK